jgi:hypothetical protein
LPSDYFTIHIAGLPPGSWQNQLAVLFQKFKISSVLAHAKIMRAKEDRAGVTAAVRFSDKQSADLITGALYGGREGALDGFHAKFVHSK